MLSAQVRAPVAADLSPSVAWSESAGEDAGAGVGAGQAEPTVTGGDGHIGVAARVGLSGFGVDVGAPLGRRLGRHLGVRVGGDFIRYRGSFEDQGATIDAFLQFGYGRATLDYFPRGGRFHISPLLIFANNTRVQANVTVDSTQELTLGGDQFQSSPTDPLHGVGRVELRHTAPGLSVGFGNLTRGRSHFFYPVELGFFYVAQPKLTVDFSGTACDISHPEGGCVKVQDNVDFQKSLSAFVARNNHNLSYAQFLPILNVGVGYRF